MLQKSIPVIGLVLLLAACAPAPLPLSPDVPAPVVVAPAAAEPAVPAAPEEDLAAPLEVDVNQAIIQALASNPDITVRAIDIDLRRTYEQSARAAFGMTLEAGLEAQRVDGVNMTGGDEVTDSFSGDVSASTTFMTGTTVTAGLSADLTDDAAGGPDDASSRLTVTVNQPLMQGGGRQVNTIELGRSRIDTEISQFEFKGYAEYVASETEKAYWDYTLALRQVEIYTESLDLANKQLYETKQRIEIGKLSEVERVAAEAEVALRNVSLLNASNRAEQARIRLIRFLDPVRSAAWDRTITLKETVSDQLADTGALEPYVKAALVNRSELNQARLELEKGTMTIEQTKNGLLPRLDFFASLGLTGYDETVGTALGEIGGDYYSAGIGLSYRYPLGNEQARAANERAALSQRRATEAFRNLVSLVQYEIRTAFLAMTLARESIPATAATRLLQEQKLEVEKEKFRIGKTTTYAVSQAQRDLLESRIAEIETLIQYRRALIDLYVKEGSYLQRLGIKL